MPHGRLHQPQGAPGILQQRAEDHAQRMKIVSAAEAVNIEMFIPPPGRRFRHGAGMGFSGWNAGQGGFALLGDGGDIIRIGENVGVESIAEYDFA